jgi:hypothetical protein
MNVSYVRNWMVVVVSAALVGLWLPGCGSGGLDLGEVKGRLSLDGTPLGGATIAFAPEGGGRTSLAVSDDDGSYRLEFTADKPGALVGKHKVTITTYEAGEVDDQGKRVGAVPEKVPAKYNKQTTLVEEVKRGKQTIDFKLESK